jgi:isoleucyl-tRNA synthetase
MHEKVMSWFDPVVLEKNILAFWKKERVFQRLVEKNRRGELWSFLDGPITANDRMGLHHAWGRALKDAFQRYHAMRGKRLRYQNGFDCQGLWVEVEVEKELGLETKKDIEKYGVARFVKRCRERVEKYAGIITEQSIRLGCWMDWDNSYYTMSDENNYAIWQFLKRCHERGYIYKGHDVMPWCPRCGTGISQHEMQEGYREISYLSVVVKLPIIQRPGEAFLVWTTTPWTLAANAALAVHPDLIYVRALQEGEIYYLAKARVEAVLGERGNWQTVSELPGSTLIDAGLAYRAPFDGLDEAEEPAKGAGSRPSIVPWKEISDEEGTGIVHIAPGCGPDDFRLGKDHGLPAFCPIDESGRFGEETGWLAGKKASSVAGEMESFLADSGLLYSSAMHRHSYPHCWRCKEELLFRLVDEWFIAMDPWRDRIKSNARKALWKPAFGRELELDWLSNMQDWMISKKRYWGLSLPIWECSECGEFQVIGSSEELKRRAVAGWDRFEGNSPHRPWIDDVKISCHRCGRPAARIPDVGNPWLDAGIVPYSTTKYNTDREYWQRWVPADLVLECFPGQFRNWFYSLLAMSTMMEDIPPFKTLVGHALVKDEHGREMHKSSGNAIWFGEAADELGADVIRWLFYERDLSSHIHFSKRDARRIRGGFFNTLWNCYVFYVNYANIVGYMPTEHRPQVSKRSWLDRWILSRLHETIGSSQQSWEDYDVRGAARLADRFLDDLSNWYVRHNRRVFWKAEGERSSWSEFDTLYECLSVAIRLIAPLAPFFSEAIYQNLVRPVDKRAPISVHLTEYPQPNAEVLDSELMRRMRVVRRIVSAGVAARKQAGIKIRQPLSKVTVFVTEEDEKMLAELQPLIRDDLNVKEVVLSTKCIEPPEERTEGTSVVEFEEGCLFLDTELTGDLIREGAMREFLRKAQVMRKKLGLQIEDRIVIRYGTGSTGLREALAFFKDHICSELLCLKMTEEPDLKQGRLIEVGGDSVLLHIEAAEQNKTTEGRSNY